MKVCEKCAAEICTRDGENKCAACESGKCKAKAARERRKAMAEAMESIGLVKVRGAMGGTYWE